MPSKDKRSRSISFISILSKHYEQFTSEFFQAVAIVGMKTTCLDLELDQNSATCLCCGGHCMLGGLNFKLCFCRNGTGLDIHIHGKFLTWCQT